MDIVIRPEDLDIVPRGEGKLSGVVEDVFFKGVYYDITVETVPGTSVTVDMEIVKEHESTSDDGSEKISANDFYVDLEDMKMLDEKEIIARADAQAWRTDTDEYISIARIDYEIEEKIGTYPVKFSTSAGTEVDRKIYVIDQPYVRNEKSNEAVSAFNFYKTVEEINEAVALDTDLKTWANAQGWKLNDEEQSVDIYVSYDFDVDDIREGQKYKVTFSTEGREFKINTTDFVEVGREVDLNFFPEDIHVMRKRIF